mmetsp:Transcript_38300/g.53170  ORF Transcript_38300/g.53170 Transcript_38300/m.53170 type:complete len:147 (-) Transcript_38300:160-600(-)|eukprot:CAMPEP_0196571150 /NCGR_PEP_ID=MMETSP1081-20130531/1316_1 /TAXON_ID=36882 /ORGANISM="Pyramimonas amylifera, Strain CCMP720" /LENGTH=146 /DNA_ID=CAMNT_0041887959 /DNA_START=153 /DNA_END=593 /DNA_ORIENTATION=+
MATLLNDLLALVESQAYQSRVDAFMKEHCDSFCRQPGQDGTTHLEDKCEQAHENHEVYEKYTALIESQLEDFLRSKGISQEELFVKLAEDEMYHQNNMQGSRLRALLASFDYNEFLNIMLICSDKVYEAFESDNESKAIGNKRRHD